MLECELEITEREFAEAMRSDKPKLELIKTFAWWNDTDEGYYFWFGIEVLYRETGEATEQELKEYIDTYFSQSEAHKLLKF